MLIDIYKLLLVSISMLIDINKSHFDMFFFFKCFEQKFYFTIIRLKQKLNRLIQLIEYVIVFFIIDLDGNPEFWRFSTSWPLPTLSYYNS